MGLRRTNSSLLVAASTIVIIVDWIGVQQSERTVNASPTQTMSVRLRAPDALI